MRYLNTALSKRIDYAASMYTRVLARTWACCASANVSCSQSVRAASRWICRKLKNRINLTIEWKKNC